MDAVEAIDAWIDETIDDLTDEELERILDILDVVAVSPYAQTEPDVLDDEDIADLADLAGEGGRDTDYVELVLRAALFGEPFDDESEVDADVVDDADEGDGDDDSDEADERDERDDTLAAAGADAEDSDSDDPIDWDDSDEHDGEYDGDGATDDVGDTDFGGVVLGSLDSDEAEAGGELDAEPERDDAGFLSDLAAAQRTDEVSAVRIEPETTILDVPAWATNVQPVELRTHDELGPAFLPEPERSSNPDRFKVLALTALMVGGLIAFGIGMLRLIDSLDEPSDVAVEAEPSVTAAVEPTETPTPEPETTDDGSSPDAAAAALSEQTEPTAVAEEPPPDPRRVAVRLVSGDVVVASPGEFGQAPEVESVYASVEGELPPARDVVWGPFGIAVIDNDGAVVLAGADIAAEPTLLFEANDELGEAVELAAVSDQLAIRTESGSIVLVPAADSDAEAVEVVWDAAEEEIAAVDISSTGTIVPFALENGDARMIVTERSNTVIAIWRGENEPAAFRVDGAADAILLAIGDGDVVRYLLGDDVDERVEDVWGPVGDLLLPAFGSRAVDDRVLLVLSDGSVRFADPLPEADTSDADADADAEDEDEEAADADGDPAETDVDADGDEAAAEAILWDPAVTEIRAFVASPTATHAIVLLEIGTVLRIPFDAEQPIESVWDITDETLALAAQIAVEPADS